MIKKPLRIKQELRYYIDDIRRLETLSSDQEAIRKGVDIASEALKSWASFQHLGPVILADDNNERAYKAIVISATIDESQYELIRRKLCEDLGLKKPKFGPTIVLSLRMARNILRGELAPATTNNHFKEVETVYDPLVAMEAMVQALRSSNPSHKAIIADFIEKINQEDRYR